MKHTFQKAISVLLAVIMIASLCTVAMTTVSAEELTAKDLGLYSGSAVYPSAFVENPDDPSETVLKMPYGNGRYNYRLADPADASKPIVVEKDKFYTITFDYRVDAVGDNATNVGFELYYGLTDDGGYGKKPVSAKKSWAIYDIEGGNINGVWRSAAIHFKADPYEVTESVVAGQDPETGADIVDTNVVATLNNIYVTFHNPVGVEGYVKNFNIIEETDAGDNTFVEDTTNMKSTLDHKVGQGSEYGSGMVGQLDENTGNLILSGGNGTNFATGDSAWVKHRCVVNNSGDKVAIYAGNSYTFALKYRVLNNSDWITVGVGYAKDGTSNTDAASQVVKADKTTGGQTTEWRYLTGTFTPTLNDGVTTAYPRIILSDSTGSSEVPGVGAIEIESFSIAGSSMANVVTNIYNDNGDNITVKTGYKGTSVVVDGNKSEHTVETGETFIGWYADAKFTKALDGKVPAESGTVYAKYPTTVIDNFYMLPSYISGTHVSKGTFEKSNNGWKLGGTSGHGFLIPAYDDSTVAFYEFKPDVQYIVKIHYASHTVTAAKPTTSNINIYYGDGYGNDYVRTVRVDCNGVNLATTTQPGVVEFKFTHKTTTKTKNEVEHIVNTAIVRASDSSAVTGVIDMTKIEIVELSQESIRDGGLKVDVTLDYNDGVTENEVLTLGYYDIKELPIPTREGYIFAGWYKNYRTTSHSIDTDDIPVTALSGHIGLYNATYVAQWISTATNRVEFSEGAYSNIEGYDISSAFSIVTDNAIDADSADNAYAMMDTVTTNKDNNYYKVSLFNDDGSRILAYEGVTYRFTIRYKVVDDLETAGLQIGVARSGIKTYGPEGLGGGNSISVVATSKNTDGFVTATAEFKVKGIYTADKGLTAGVTDRVRSQLALRMNNGIAYIDYVEVTALSYTPAYANFIENATVSVDYENLTFTVIPDEGYEMKLGTASSKTTYLDYTIANDPANQNKETCYPVDTEAYYYSDLYVYDDGYTYDFYYDEAEGDRLSSIAFMAEMVEKGSTINADIIGMSIREEKAALDNNGVYQSAGIRFRARISNSTLAGATEVGYIFVPTKALEKANVTAIEDYLASDGSAAVKGIAKAADTDVIYEKYGENYTDYQAVLTGLTNEAGTRDLTDLYVSVAFYVTDANGTTYIQYDNVKYSDLQ